MNFSRFAEGLRLGMGPEVAMRMTNVYGGGGQKQEQNSEQDSTPYQTSQFDTLLKGANAWLSKGGFQKQYGGSAGFDSVANMNQTQLDALSGSAATGNQLQGMLGTQGMSSLGDYLGAYDPNKTGLTGAINASNEAMNWDYGTQVAPQIRQGATDAGQFGSTRHGVAEGIAQSRLSQQKMNAANTMAYQDQQAYNQNRLGVLGNLSSIASGLNAGNTMALGAGSAQQQQAQNEINGQLEKWAYENNVSLNDLTAYKALISGDMGGSSKGSSQGTGAGGSGGMGALASFGGSALGSYMGG
jgi:hypothetical protein